MRGNIEESLARDIERALALAHSRPLTGESVHRIRTRLKRARAALRLLRDAGPKGAYATQNRLLRDAGRRLAPARDSLVLAQAFDSLAKGSRRRALQGLRGELRAQSRRELAELQVGSALAQICRVLDEVRARIQRRDLPDDAGSMLRPGLRRIYRNGRRALQLARTKTSDGALHETRKQAKYLEAALGMLEPRLTGRAKKVTQRAAQIARRLGDDHDLAMLAAKLRKEHEGDPAARQAVLARLERERRKLQKNALKRAERLYRRKPGAFVERLGR
jgi:CHAD domain-containing protein